MTIETIALETLLQTREELVKMIHKNLTSNHRDFLLGLKNGTPDWSLIPFENIANLPSVKWKILNLQKMQKDKRQEAYEKLKLILAL